AHEVPTSPADLAELGQPRLSVLRLCLRSLHRAPKAIEIGQDPVSRQRQPLERVANEGRGRLLLRLDHLGGAGFHEPGAPGEIVHARQDLDCGIESADQAHDLTGAVVLVVREDYVYGLSI